MKNWVGGVRELDAESSKWNYRIIDTRAIFVKGKDEDRREIRAVDLKVNLPFVLEVPKGVSMRSIEVDEEHMAMLKVYTARSGGAVVVPELVEFFKVIDVERKFEEFLKAAFIDKSLFKFELVEIELL